MAGDTRDIKINVTVDSDTRGSQQAAAGLEKVDTAAGKAEGGLADLRKESEKLDVQLAKSKTKVHELEQELIRSGDRTTGRGSLRSRLNQERRWLAELEKLSKSAVGSTLDVPLKFDFAGAFEGGLSKVKGPAIAAIVGLAALSAPAIGAVIAGAVAGTVAGGGILGGVIAATNDSRVRAAFKDLTSEFTAEAFGGEAFVEPVVKGIGILKESFRDLNLDEALAKGASSVPILADGIAGLVTNIMPGFNDVMDKAESFTHVFADGLKGTGSALSSFLHSITQSEGTIEGLAFGFKVLNGTIVATGQFLGWLGDRFHDMVTFNAWLSGNAEDVFGWVPWLGTRIREMNDNMEDTAAVGWKANEVVGGVGAVIREAVEPTESETEALKRLNDELFRTVMAGLEVDAAADRVAASFMDLADSVVENGTSLDQWDQQGNKNRQTIRGLIGDLEAQRQANIDNGMAVGEANRLFEEQANALQNRLIVELGFANDEVANLIGNYKNIPTVVTTEFRAIYTESTGGYGGGEHSGVGDERGRKAAGGFVSAGMSYLVGENQAEVFTPKTNGYISPSVGAWASGMGGGGGSSPIVISFAATGDPFLDAMIRELRKYIRVEGGDVQTVLGR